MTILCQIRHVVKWWRRLLRITPAYSRRPPAAADTDVRRMNILSWMRDRDRRVGLRIYKHLRLGLAVASPLFVVAGVLGLLGFPGQTLNRLPIDFGVTIGV